MARRLYIIILIAILANPLRAQHSANSRDSLVEAFTHPPESASPWVFWYWMQGAVSKAGITADLEAMKQSGIGGAYLMPIKDTANPPVYQPTVRQLSPEWWAMVRFAMSEADRLGLKMAMHVSDGFALAGGPWITPELSMQKVVWTKTNVSGGQHVNQQILQPEAVRNYYRDIAVYAYPTLPDAGITTLTTKPFVTASTGESDLDFLTTDTTKKTFTSKDPAWVQYAFAQPFTCRSIIIRTKGNNYQAQRLTIEVSNDGKSFYGFYKLQPPRSGWQDGDADNTYSIPAVPARYFRFVYDKTGSEPGAEDLDAAKWKPVFKVSGIELSGEPLVPQYEGKSGLVWRVSPRATKEQLPDALCIPKDRILDITNKMSADGHLDWNVPKGNWTILRMGHTSTGHTNATGGGGAGLECDKFNPEAITLQFNSWFGAAFRNTDSALASRVLKVFHVDSWECGSQNWSPVFAAEFKKRRGYDLLSYLPVMAGVPIGSADTAERVLYDIRETIAELIADKFYVTLKDLAHAKGCTFTAESVAPTMTSDGMLQYRDADIPMGEFWLRSPTHDKPNDMLDAVSGGHIYGKNIIQAESFTELRTLWDEQPAMLKPLADRAFALGVNRLVYHVFVHNPWTDRKPGMTLDGIGLYFQRDQTWWKPGKAWVDYARRCQALLQMGRPVADILVFTGEEIPRRSVLPDQLVSSLPGLFGQEIVDKEAARLANKGEPIREQPTGVFSSANMVDPKDWIDALHGYKYDCINKDALLRLATVKDGRIVLPGGGNYSLLIIPASRPMNPNGNLMSEEVAEKLLALANAGATIRLCEPVTETPGLNDRSFSALKKLAELQDETSDNLKSIHDDHVIYHSNNGRIILGKTYSDISKSKEISAIPDFTFSSNYDDSAAISKMTVVDSQTLAWTHRSLANQEIYFVANQANRAQKGRASIRLYNTGAILDGPDAIILEHFRTLGIRTELWNPITGERTAIKNGRITTKQLGFDLNLDPYASVFIILSRQDTFQSKPALTAKKSVVIANNWKVQFDPGNRGPVKAVVFPKLTDWSQSNDSSIRYYSGTATYTQPFNLAKNSNEQYWLDLGKVADMAEVTVNGIDCGTAWTPPYRVDITKALKAGRNELKIAVTNTWANRITGDQRLPEKQRLTHTNAPYRLEGKALLPAGLLGPVRIVAESLM